MDAAPAEKLRFLMEMVCVNQLTRHDQAVRRWALGEPEVQKLVRKADQFRQRYVKSLGIGTLVSIMLPYSIFFIVLWSAFLLIYYAIGLPLGIQASYTYP